MCLAKWLRRRKKRRRERIYEGPCMDGGTRISNDTDAPNEDPKGLNEQIPLRFCRGFCHKRE